MENTENEETKRARRELFLKEWQLATSVFDARITTAVSAAIDFAALGIKSLYLLHGGALVALPAFYEKLLKSGDQAIVYSATSCYIIGICFTLVLNVSSYFAMCFCEKANNIERNVAADKVYSMSYERFGVDTDRDVAENTKRAHFSWVMFKIVRGIAIVAAGISLAMFIQGSRTMLNGASASLSLESSKQDNLIAESTTVIMPIKSSRKSDGHLFLEWPCERFRFDVPGGMELGGTRLPCLTCGGCFSHN